jgi:hypothetical protein
MPVGNTQRNVLSTGRLHQHSSAQPHWTAPIPSTNRPTTASKRYTDTARTSIRFIDRRVGLVSDLRPGRQPLDLSVSARLR